MDGINEADHIDKSTDHDARFNQSEIVDMVNEQIQVDYGNYLRQDAKEMDNGTVEIKPGTEFETAHNMDIMIGTIKAN